MGDVQKKKYRIGYTTGVFDMFHIGHLAILKRAKEMCDFLIVGVSTDELVETYKHKMPIVPLADRMEIVGAIRYPPPYSPPTRKSPIAPMPDRPPVVTVRLHPVRGTVNMVKVRAAAIVLRRERGKRI